MSASLETHNDFSLEWTGWRKIKKPRFAYCAEMQWSELVEAIQEPQPMPAAGKDALNAWNLGVFREGYRTGDAHLYATGIIIDYDSAAAKEGCDRGNPGLTADALKACWQRFRFLAHTTASHRVGQARWRVILPFDRKASADELKRVGQWLVRYGNDNGAPGLDKDTCWHSASCGLGGFVAGGEIAAIDARTQFMQACEANGVLPERREEAGRTFCLQKA